MKVTMTTDVLDGAEVEITSAAAKRVGLEKDGTGDQDIDEAKCLAAGFVAKCNQAAKRSGVGNCTELNNAKKRMEEAEMWFRSAISRADDGGAST